MILAIDLLKPVELVMIRSEACGDHMLPRLVLVRCPIDCVVCRNDHTTCFHPCQRLESEAWSLGIYVPRHMSGIKISQFDANALIYFNTSLEPCDRRLTPPY